jgi:hypothetical protein
VYDAALVLVLVVATSQLHSLLVLPQAIAVLLVWMVSMLDNDGNHRVLFLVLTNCQVSLLLLLKIF